MTMVGIDIIEIERLAKTDSEAFMARCFTPFERKYLDKRGPQTKAGLFAAKEAVVKAMGTGFRGFWPCQVEIYHDANGKPRVCLYGKALMLAKKKRIRHIELSISHDNSTAVSVAVIEVRERTGKYARCHQRGNARD